nr:Chain G, APC membrane recruitment protein 1 [Homo sapiens]4YJL_H Chain H, APC membrane recruitment protein 1 [Homo sapiens]4YJL_I Chain I, APC membrane recruitment protein 1 [Homo sapiens]4YJL_J Chain J, APC membrane recruitment protein 1 [Homo sapiens]4YJL_K Chain K, APC membrane recruitment protein 1 [Homo sapiens]4YJL_L Chain L, APC membrane recruitment protein 1 [Homo sapiens]
PRDSYSGDALYEF